jgi:dCMP deaminase
MNPGRYTSGYCGIHDSKFNDAKGSRLAMPEHKRPSWDEYFCEVVLTVGKRGNCDRGRSGAVIVVDRHIVATGYVGAPVGCATCDEIGHLMKTAYDERGGEHHHCTRTTHAEMNAVAQAAKKGTPIDGGTIYCKMTPCLDCTKLLINGGIKRVVALKRYHADHDSIEVLKEAGVVLDIVDEAVEQYEDM